MTENGVSAALSIDINFNFHFFKYLGSKVVELTATDLDDDKALGLQGRGTESQR